MSCTVDTRQQIFACVQVSMRYARDWISKRLTSVLLNRGGVENNIFQRVYMSTIRYYYKDGSMLALVGLCDM